MRAVSTLGRLVPALLVGGALVIVGIAAGVAACGGLSGGQTPAPTATVTVTTSPSAQGASPSPTSGSATSSTLAIYFARGGKLGVATRTAPATKMVATAALKALCAGPTAKERAAGLSSDIPGDTHVVKIAIAGGTATVDLSSPFAGPATNAAAARRVAAVVYTLTQFPTVKRTVITVGGAPLTEIQAAGGGSPLTVASPQRRADLVGLEPAIFVESPGVGAVLSNPFTLAGTASVFEGSFTARLLDSSGRRIVSLSMQATRGAPGRGRFRRTVAFSTAAREGTLLVYSQSMEDGSRQNVVRIPVIFGH